jgi:hypothetical protein
MYNEEEFGKKFLIADKSEPYGNPVVEKSFKFAVRIINFCKYALEHNRQLVPILKQILRSGTSIGANISEAHYASSKKILLIN